MTLAFAVDLGGTALAFTPDMSGTALDMTVDFRSFVADILGLNFTRANNSIWLGIL